MMGGKKGKRAWKRRKEYLDDKSRKKPRAEGVRGNWEPIPKVNEAFEKYYKDLGIIPEGEWDDFMGHFRKDLPATFRVVDSRGDSVLLNNLMKERYFSRLEGVEIEGQEVRPETLPWYPGGRAWQINMTRPMLRSCEKLFELHQFLISEVERGSVARQEAVSMIPPLCLDVQPHHTVLDMCAAPGSKTLQLLEALHADGPDPSGLVIANDGDNKRCYMLVTQTKRFNSLAFMITNEDATRYPNLKVYNGESKLVDMRYDRILCDVPCTGDGTLRKNYAIWKKWYQGQAIGIHKLQRRILLRAMDMLAEGGRIVYSTCSLNPLENEATVLSCLRNRTNFQLMPTDHLLPELKRRPGLTTWRVFHAANGGKWFDSFEEVEEWQRKTLAPTLFPVEAEQHNLDRCMRVYPHLQNTGGFFICVIERKPKELVEGEGEKAKETEEETEKTGEEEGVKEADEVKKSDEAEESTAVEGQSNDEEGEKDKKVEKKETIHTNTNLLVEKQTWKEYHGFREDPYLFLTSDSDCLKPIKEWYEISESFPATNLFARSSENTKQRKLSVACDRIRHIIEQNEKKVKIINCGLKLFAYCKPAFSKCPYRLLQSGVHYTAQFLGSHLYTVTRSDMEAVLGAEGVQKEALQLDLYEKLKDLPTMVIAFHLPAEGLIPEFWTCIYTTANTVKAYVSEDEKNHFRLLLGMEPLLTEREKRKLVAMEKYRQKKKEEAEAAEAGGEGSDPVGGGETDPDADVQEEESAADVEERTNGD